MVTSSDRNISFDDLCEATKQSLPSSLPQDAWYLIVATTVVACQKPQEIASLWKYLTRSLNSEEKERLSKRLRDVLLKEWTLIGIPPVVVAFISLAEAEGNVDKAQTESVISPQLQDYDMSPNSPIWTRGTERIQSIYQQNLSPIFSSWGSHRADMEYVERSIIYGLFLSDLTVLDSVEAQIVVLVAILCTGYGAPSIWHLRGLRRLGLGEDQVDAVRNAVARVAKWSGVDEGKVDEWPSCKDILDKV